MIVLFPFAVLNKGVEMWTRSNKKQSTEEKRKFHQVNKQERWVWNSDLLGEGFMHMQGGHLLFKSTTDSSVIIFIMHCFTTWAPSIYREVRFLHCIISNKLHFKWCFTESEHFSHWGNNKSAPPGAKQLTWKYGVMALQKREKGLVKQDAGEVTVKGKKSNNEVSTWAGDGKGKKDKSSVNLLQPP